MRGRRPSRGRANRPDSGGCPSRGGIIGKGGFGATRDGRYPQGNGGGLGLLGPKDRFRDEIWRDAVDVRLSDEQQAIEDDVTKVCALSAISPQRSGRPIAPGAIALP